MLILLTPISNMMRDDVAAQSDRMMPLAAQRDAFLAAIKSQPVLMGIVNVTPDSFSDGGLYDEAGAATDQAQRLVADGAGIIDLGAESTRPGHVPVDAEEEWRRLAPVLERLVESLDAPLSVDTTKASVAARALQAGACVINDIWGLQGDPAMADVVAQAHAAIIIMHNRATPDPSIDIVYDMRRFFDHSLDRARRAGISEQHIMLDPGIGFGKTQSQNWQALHATANICALGFPVLIGVSRKSLFGHLLGSAVADRLVPTIAANLHARAAGARIFRVHDVAEHRAAFAVADAIDHG